MKHRYIMSALLGTCMTTVASNIPKAVQLYDHGTHCTIESIYGTIDVHDPLLYALIQSPEMQRLHGIHQYGPWDYVIGPSPYNRFDHSIGTFILTYRFGGNYYEQIAALLHDVSHTVFSHAGGWIYHSDYKKADAHQDDIHHWYLLNSTIPALLQAYGISINDIHHKHNTFTVLEQELPDICADRLDYNIQGAYIEGYITQDDVHQILAALHVENGRWYFDIGAIARKFAELSLYMTRNIWGSPTNGIIYSLLGKALAHARSKEIIHDHDIHHGQDDAVWQKLCTSTDDDILQLIYLMRRYQTMFIIDENSPVMHVRAKFRGIDPWIQTDEGFKRLSTCDETFNALYQRINQEVTTGWPMRCIAASTLTKNVMHHEP